jgi:hypothetical protein
MQVLFGLKGKAKQLEKVHLYTHHGAIRLGNYAISYY